MTDRYRSAEEILERHIRDMGEELGRVYNALTTEVSWLHVKCGLWRQLYAQSPQRAELLVDGADLVLPVRRLANDGLEAWGQVLERGYEGLVGKDEASPYVEGRTLSWLKVKVPKYREGERGWDPKR